MDILNNFGITWIALLENAITFFIIVILLYKFAYKPTFKVLDKRKEIIKKSLEEASEIEKQKLEMQKEYRKSIKKANEESKRIIDESINQAALIAKQINVDARNEANRTLQKAQEEIANQKEEMFIELKKDMMSLITHTLSKVLKDSLSEDEQKKIVNKAINEIK